MCLHIKSGPHVATKNIAVFKALNTTNLAPYFGYYYRSNHFTRKVVLRPSGHWARYYPPTGNIRVINEGYHAHLAYKKAQSMASNSWVTRKVVIMVIPKGATYYIGKHGDVVSSQLFTGDLEHFDPYLK